MEAKKTAHTYSSSELINLVLDKLGLTRENISTYNDYALPNGKYLRLRISEHGVNLSTWFQKNKEHRAKNPSLPKLNTSTNIAVTFAPNEEECMAKGVDFPQKAINKTKVKTDDGNNIKPQFSVGHIQYASWLLTNTDAELIATAIKAFTESGVYIDPLGLSSGKIIAWNDTSNLPAKKLTKSTDTIKLKESDLRAIINECVKKILFESNTTSLLHKSHEYKPIGSHKFWSNQGNTEWKSIITLQSPSSKQCCHIAEDDHCYVLFN